jgi:hypothetical protein
MGFLDGLKGIKLSIGSSPPRWRPRQGCRKAGLSAGGAALGSAANASANNRGEKLSAQQDIANLLLQRDRQYQDMQIAREQEGRAGASDAYKKLLSTSHLLNPGPQSQLAGKYSIAPRQAGPEEMQGAEALRAEVMKRLTGGNQMPQVQPTDLGIDRNLMNPGVMEKIGGYAAPALDVLSRLNFGKKQAASAPPPAMNPGIYSKLFQPSGRLG